MGRSRRTSMRRPTILCLPECSYWGLFRIHRTGHIEFGSGSHCPRNDRSLLWRTAFGGQRVMGASGSVLCLGRLNDDQAKAIVFQNAEGPLDYTLTADDHRPMAQKYHNPLASWKAGFLCPPLPPPPPPNEIREFNFWQGAKKTIPFYERR